jgi:predicted permease
MFSWRRRPQQDFSEEIRAHLDAEAAALESEGLSPEAARAAAARAFGNVTHAEERFYESLRWPGWDAIARDLRYAVRTLRGNPGLVTVLVLCLGLGIGLNATIFGVLNGALLQGPTAVEPDRLVRIEPGNGDQISYLNYRDLRGTTGFDDLVLTKGTGLNLQSGDELEPVSVLQVSANYFEVLGVTAFRGRTFTDSEAAPERRPLMAVLEHGFWRRTFQEDQNVVGRTLILSGHRYLVIGVLRRDHRVGMGLYVPDVYVPISPLLSASLEDRRGAAFDLRGRLARGISHGQAQAAFTAAAQRLESVYPDVNEGLGRPAWVLPVSGLGSLQGRGVPSQLPLLVAVPFILFALLLLTACANVAGVLIARGASRRGEIAIRLALGASRASVVRMLLAECAVLTVLATIGGVLLAAAVSQLVTQVHLPNAPVLQVPPIRIDINMMIYGVAVAAVTCMLCGLMPALQSTRVALTPGLRESKASGRRSGGRNILVAVQVAVSVLLLTTCVIFLRSLQHLTTVHPGFDVTHGVTARVTYDPQQFTPPQLYALAQQVVTRLEQIPEVRSASFATLLPLGGDALGRRAELRDMPGDKGLRVSVNHVGPRFFETMDIRVRGGREFLASDRLGAPPVVIVNEAFARRAYANQPAIGRIIRLATPEPNPWREIVGVVADSKYASLTEAPEPQVFMPYLQTGDRLVVQVRTRNPSPLSFAVVKAAIADVDRTVRANVQTTEQATSLEFSLRRATTILLAGLGGIGLLLAMVGLFGVLAWNVSRRTAEIGVRMALGASRNAVRAEVLKSGLMVVGVGTALGLGAGVLVTWPLRSFLPGASPGDPLTLGIVTAVLLVTGALASVIPAHRASGVDPAVALRRD